MRTLEEARYGDMIEVKHLGASYGELRDLRDSGTNLERTPHPGNVGLVELTLLTDLGVEPLLVDTVNGGDEYSQPAFIVIGTEKRRIVSRKLSKLRVLQSIEYPGDDALSTAGLDPSLLGELQPKTLYDLHVGSLDLIDTSRSLRPTGIVERLSQNPGLLESLMETSAVMGINKRVVDETGKILPLEEVATDYGVFGLEDHTGKSTGALVTLGGMMAGLLVRANLEGRDETAHLAGGSMKQYTRDAELMEVVAQIYTGTCRRLGIKATELCFNIYDITRVNKLVSDTEPPISSQYDMITRGIKRISVSPDQYDQPVFRTDR